MTAEALYCPKCEGDPRRRENIEAHKRHAPEHGPEASTPDPTPPPQLT